MPFANENNKKSSAIPPLKKSQIDSLVAKLRTDADALKTDPKDGHLESLKAAYHNIAGAVEEKNLDTLTGPSFLSIVEQTISRHPQFDGEAKEEVKGVAAKMFLRLARQTPPIHQI